MTAQPEAGYEHIAVTRACPALGARVEGADLSRLDEPTVAEIQRAFLDHHVLVFPDQHLSPADQVRFTRRFGEVERHPLYRTAVLPEQPEILVLEHRAGQWINGRNDVWHADITFAERPPLGSVLYCKDAITGYGDTLFCNMIRVYEALSPGLRRLLDGLEAEHGADRMIERNNRESYQVPMDGAPPPVRHPVVRTHPGSGRRGLFVNPIYTLGLAGCTREESAVVLDPLYAIATRPENVYRHRWRVGDVVLFDNRCLMHYVAVDYGAGYHRLMHRTTARGDRPA